MRLFLVVVALSAGMIAGHSSAGPREFPYEAILQADGIVVRSGPGERYDPTMKLGKRQHVTVHRHDPGGWFMISPPPGSFSWIDSTYVEKTGPETGVVKIPSAGNGLPPRVVVWIGSQFTDDHKYFGRQLANGDELRILGEKQQQTDGGPITFYKIAPPRLEYRWVKGDFVVPLAEAGSIAQTPSVATPPVPDSTQQRDPFSRTSAGPAPMSAPGFPPEQGPTLLQRDLTREISPSSLDRSSSARSTTTAERTQLTALDERLQAMLAQTPEHWDLTGMEGAYRQLQASAAPGLAAQIDYRLAALESRKKIKAEYDSFVGVLQRTEQRDAELLSMQQSIASGLPASTTQVDLGQPAGFPPHALQGPATQQQAIPPIASRTPGDQAATPQLDGAGVVQRLQRAIPGMPQYVLMSPNGQLLAYLAPGQGIRLDQYLGRAMGVIGRRSHDPRLRSDVIVVERLTPVRLQP